jgi:hypothetical protein
VGQANRMPGVDAIEVFADTDGYIILRQDDRLSDTDSAVVRLLPVQVPAVIKWLQQAAKDAEQEAASVERG